MPHEKSRVFERDVLDGSELVPCQVLVYPITQAQLAALARVQGIRQMRLGGELLSMAVESMFAEVFNVQAAGAMQRPSVMDGKNLLWQRKDKRDGKAS